MAKNVTIRVFKDGSGEYVGTIPIVSEINFTQTLNAGLGELVLQVPTQIDNFHEGTLIDYMNRVEVLISDKEAPGGRLIYSGYIDTYEPTQQGNREYVTVRILGYHTMMGYIAHASFADQTLTYTSINSDLVFKDVMDKYLFQHTTGGSKGNSPITYTSSSIQTGGNAITDDYNSLSSLEALDRTVDNAGAGWSWYVDANNTVHMKQKPSTPTHTFWYGRDIVQPFKVTKSVTDVAQRVLSWDQNLLSYLFFRDTYTSKYWRRYTWHNDAAVPNATTAGNIASKIIDNRETPNQQIQFRVLDSNSTRGGYDIESIQIGDTFQIVNIDKGLVFSDNIQITSMKKTLDYVDIVGEDLRRLTSRSLTDLQRSIKQEQFQAGQPNVTTQAV